MSQPLENNPAAEAARAFQRRSSLVAADLQAKLAASASFHDLNAERLWNTHRKVAELARKGTVPTATEFWSQTASPQAQTYLDSAKGAVDAELDTLTGAMQRYATDVGLALRPQNRGERARLLHPHIQIADDGIDLMIRTITSQREINNLGAWWQGRLRNRAMMKAAGRLLISPVSRFELVLASAEMELLSEPPWSHDDRLLSAFELAHGRLRDHGLDLERRLRRQARAMFDRATDDSGGGHPKPRTGDTNGHRRPRAEITERGSAVTDHDEETIELR